MKRLLIISIASLSGLLGLAASSALAQNIYPYTQPNFGPYYRPQLSPYLDLLRGGNPASNYFLGTLPEFQRRANAQMFRSSILELDRRVTEAAVAGGIFTPLGTTGHPTVFNYTGTYFNTTIPGTPNTMRMPRAGASQPTRPQGAPQGPMTPGR
jgi:hypothetical protein